MYETEKNTISGAFAAWLLLSFGGVVPPHFRQYGRHADRYGFRPVCPGNLPVAAAAAAGQTSAWFSIGMDAPLWVTLLATGLFLAKSLLELYLIIRYEREM